MYPRHRHISPTALLVFAIPLVFSTVSLVNSDLLDYHRGRNESPWDILIFTQNWPVSVCEKWMNRGRYHVCQKFPDNTWTIHGLWPTKKGMIGPNFCNAYKHFSPEAIYGIEKELLKFWPPIEKHGSEYMFWAHEWEKHGTCAAVLPQFSTEYDYFYETLQLLKKYNMNDVLSKARILPGGFYNITEIWDGVKGVLNVNSQVNCFEHGEITSTLVEIRICLDKSLQPVDCDGTIVGYEVMEDSFSLEMWRRRHRRRGYKNLTNCNMEKLVHYPPGVHQSVINSIEKSEMEENPLVEKQ